MSKLEITANDKKAGMTLLELKEAIERFYAIADINQTIVNDSTVLAFVNIKGGIKQLIAEV